MPGGVDPVTSAEDKPTNDSAEPPIDNALLTPVMDEMAAIYAYSSGC